MFKWMKCVNVTSTWTPTSRDFQYTAGCCTCGSAPFSRTLLSLLVSVPMTLMPVHQLYFPGLRVVILTPACWEPTDTPMHWFINHSFCNACHIDHIDVLIKRKGCGLARRFLLLYLSFLCSPVGEQTYFTWIQFRVTKALPDACGIGYDAVLTCQTYLSQGCPIQYAKFPYLCLIPSYTCLQTSMFSGSSLDRYTIFQYLVQEVKCS